MAGQSTAPAGLTSAEPESRAQANGPLIPLLGAPTASGKSAAAVELAARLPLEIVTADAMQVYRGMDVGTAKPGPDERRAVPHHLIDVVDPDEPFSVAQWVELAHDAIASILARGNIPLVVGGTGFYLAALQQGMPTAPPADPQVQEEIWAQLEEQGLDSLIEELAATSPVDAIRGERNPRRIVRAVEILRRTGKAPAELPFTTPRYPVSLAVLEPPLELLRPRIEQRCGQMFANGLVEEVRRLLARPAPPATALQAIGYKEVAEALRGEATLDEAQGAVEVATVRYAKRQLTCFRRQPAQLRLPLLAGEALPRLEAWLRELAG